MILGREPALWGALVRAVILLVTTMALNLTTDQQGWVNAVTAALVGLVVAATVSGDKLVPAILGLLEAILAGAVAWGWNLPPDRQMMIMSVAAAIVAIWTRDRVVAPIDEAGNRR